MPISLCGKLDTSSLVWTNCQAGFFRARQVAEKNSEDGRPHNWLTTRCFVYPLHEVHPVINTLFLSPKLFSKTFKFSIIFYSTWQISGSGQFRKACRSWKKESKQSEITWKQSEPVRSIFKIEKKRGFVRALSYV